MENNYQNYTPQQPQKQNKTLLYIIGVMSIVLLIAIIVLVVMMTSKKPTDSSAVNTTAQSESAAGYNDETYATTEIPEDEEQTEEATEQESIDSDDESVEDTSEEASNEAQSEQLSDDEEDARELLKQTLHNNWSELGYSSDPSTGTINYTNNIIKVEDVDCYIFTAGAKTFAVSTDLEKVYFNNNGNFTLIDR